ncbi:MAG: deacylase [Desulfovibrio sp.]|jgi:hypothetical protein|nr:deacylase [Desulfovibrio sp.]
MRRSLSLALFVLLALATAASAARPHKGRLDLDFTTVRLGHPSQTVLVVGGIQGDEPGGFSAATLLATRYTILSGAMWVVPNLNFPSIIKRSRGLYGDMNRKFDRIKSNDPDFPKVRRIQELIRHPDVALILNLHDGSGYYRAEYQGPLFNPSRWGQSVIIDQETLEETPLGNLLEEAQQVCDHVNTKLKAPHHRFHVHNTRTAEGDREMEKSLTYYAVRHGKAAFGLETSKEFPVELRTYYHLLMAEALLDMAGVTFQRDFAMTPEGVREALRSNLEVSFADNRIFLPLDDIRPTIRFLPLPKGARAVTSKPIMAVLPCLDGPEGLCIHYGNRTIARIHPEWRELDHDISGVRLVVDGEERDVPFGGIVPVSRTFKVLHRDGYRVNAIGADTGRRDESGIAFGHDSFLPKYSLDRQGRIFRVEVYRNQHFSGMFLVRFEGPAVRLGAKGGGRTGHFPDRAGPESSLGY